MESSAAHQLASATPVAEALPRQLGRYELVERLGGGMSEVYRARIADAIGPERPLVVKIAAQSVSDDPRASARFLDEANLALSLSHGNISSAFEFGKADGRYFIVMEYIRGASVRQLVEAARRAGQILSVGSALTVAIEVARALQYAHTFVHPEHGAMPLVHRDVNPSNVLVARDGQVKLTDFGIAHALGRDPLHGVVWGQASYVAPELLAGEPAGPASDLFALGCVLFYMLTLEPPFRGATEAETLAAIRSGTTPSARTRRPELPVEVEGLLKRLLAPAASTRPPSAEDARRALERLRERAAPDHRPSEIITLMQGLIGPEVGAALSASGRYQPLTEPTVPLVAAAPAEPIVADLPQPAGPPVPSMPAPAGGSAGSRARATAVLVATAAVAVIGTAWFLHEPSTTTTRDGSAAGVAARAADRAPQAPIGGVVSPAPAPVPAMPAVRTTTSSPPGPGPGRTKRTSGASALGVAGSGGSASTRGAPAVVTLNSWPWSIATVDGRTLPGHTPLRGIELAPGAHTFRFENPELRMRRVVTLTLAAGERRVVSAVLEPEASGGGAPTATTP